MSAALRLLILEDDPLDAELEVAMLEEAGYVCQWERVETRAEFLACLDASNYDIILADYNLPAFDGLTALQMFLDLDLDVPFILVSGTLGEETAIESLKAGATDYVLKDRLARLGPVVKRALREREDHRQRRRAEQLLQALNVAALAVQRALTHEDIFAAVAEELKKLGLFCAVFLVGEDQSGLSPSYLSYDPRAIKAAEKLVGLKHERFSMPIETIDMYGEMTRDKTAVYVENVEGVTRQWLPQPLRRFARQIVNILKVPKAISAPFIVDDKVIGLLSVQSDDLTENDVPAITAFAHQVAAAWRKAQLYEQAQEEIAERKRMEEERERLLVQIQEQAQRMQQIMDTVPEGVLLLDAGGRVVLANPVAERDIAVLADAEVGDTLIHLGDRALAELLTSPPQGLWHEVRTDTQTFEVIARPMEPALRPTADGRLSNGNGPEPENWVLVINDVTQEREVERRAQQQERLAAVGQLAAGIAHDFNNLLTTIILYAQMGLHRSGLSPESARSFETILDESRKAAELVQQILDFSRHAMLKVQTLDLKSFTREVIDILRRTIPENVHLTLAAGPQEHVVEADPTRIQQALLNLATNARDAMPEGGELRFELSCVEVGPDDEPPVATPRVPPGRWVCLSTSDTGTGMSEEAQAHLFEPFFTTKPVGKGTGLGLAQVYGIIRQHEGYIGVETEIGKGTTFHIYLPACEAEEKVAVEEVSVTLQGKGETILLVEDEEKLREGGCRILESLDYRVLTAANGREALEVYKAEGGADLVLTDLVMPEMGGKRLMHTLRKGNPGLKGLAITGYLVQEDRQALKEAGFLDVVYKPLDMDRLARAVRRALDDTS